MRGEPAGSLDAWATLAGARRSHDRISASGRWSPPSRSGASRAREARHDRRPHLERPRRARARRRLVRGRARGLRASISHRSASGSTSSTASSPRSIRQWTAADGIWPKPLQQPRPPIIVGGSAKPRTVARSRRARRRVQHRLADRRRGTRAPCASRRRGTGSGPRTAPLLDDDELRRRPRSRRARATGSRRSTALTGATGRRSPAPSTRSSTSCAPTRTRRRAGDAPALGTRTSRWSVLGASQPLGWPRARLPRSPRQAARQPDDSAADRRAAARSSPTLPRSSTPCSRARCARADGRAIARADSREVDERSRPARRRRLASADGRGGRSSPSAPAGLQEILLELTGEAAVRAGRRRGSSCERVAVRAAQGYGPRGAPRDRLHDRGGRGVRAARPERRRQDDDRRDPRGLPQRDDGTVEVLGADPQRAARVARAHRRDAPVVVAVPEPDRPREPARVRRRTTRSRAMSTR